MTIIKTWVREKPCSADILFCSRPRVGHHTTMLSLRCRRVRLTRTTGLRLLATGMKTIKDIKNQMFYNRIWHTVCYLVEMALCFWKPVVLGCCCSEGIREVGGSSSILLNVTFRHGSFDHMNDVGLQITT